MTQPELHQTQKPEAGHGVASGSAVERNRWCPFTSSKGTNCQFFTIGAWTYLHLAASKGHEFFVRAFNINLEAERGATGQDVSTLLRLQFDDATLNTWAPFIEAAGEEYRMRRQESRGPISMMWRNRQKTVPAVGILRSWLQEAIVSGKVPKEALGITMADVIDACAKRSPKGIFSLMVKYHRKPEPNSECSTWLARVNRHPYSDVGVAIAPEGLHVSLLSPKDSREPMMTAKGLRADRFMDQLDFKCGRQPARWLIPLERFLEPDFTETFLSALKKLRISLRTVVLDGSLIPNLPYGVRRATVLFHQQLRARCAEAHVVYDRVPTVGSESRSCRAFLASNEASTPQMLQAIMTQSSTECPHCRADVLLETDTCTGAPTRNVETCLNCHTTWEVGILLAERARVHGAFGLVPADSYSCS